MPSAGGMTPSTVTVTIESVNLEDYSVLFTSPEVKRQSVLVESSEGREFIKQLKPGDLVDLTYTEAMAVSIETPDSAED